MYFKCNKKGNRQHIFFFFRHTHGYNGDMKSRHINSGDEDEIDISSEYINFSKTLKKNEKKIVVSFWQIFYNVIFIIFIAKYYEINPIVLCNQNEFI